MVDVGQVNDPSQDSDHEHPDGDDLRQPPSHNLLLPHHWTPGQLSRWRPLGGFSVPRELRLEVQVLILEQFHANY